MPVTILKAFWLFAVQGFKVEGEA